MKMFGRNCNLLLFMVLVVGSTWIITNPNFEIGKWAHENRTYIFIACIVVFVFLLEQGSRRDKKQAKKEIVEVVEFSGTPDWQDRRKRVNVSGKTKEDKNKFKNENPIHRHPVLRSEYNSNSYYSRIIQIDKTIQSSLVSKIKKQQASGLRKNADEVVSTLQMLEDLGQLHATDLKSNAANDDNATHANKCETKLKQLFNAIDDLLISEASQVSDRINEIKIADDKKLYIEDN